MKEQKGFLYYFRVEVVEQDGTALQGRTGLQPVSAGVPPESDSRTQDGATEVALPSKHRRSEQA